MYAVCGAIVDFVIELLKNQYKYFVHCVYSLLGVEIAGLRRGRRWSQWRTAPGQSCARGGARLRRCWRLPPAPADSGAAPQAAAGAEAAAGSTEDCRTEN